jgi:hypothetical protein
MRDRRIGMGWWMRIVDGNGGWEWRMGMGIGGGRFYTTIVYTWP